MPTDTYIFTEAGDRIGYGHLTRCSAIQDYILNRNGNCKLFLYTNSQELNDNKNQININWIKYTDKIIRDIGNYSNVIIDSYLADHTVYEKLYTDSRFLLAIDDYNRIIYPADLVLNPNLNFDILDYSQQEATVIGGLEYIILRNDIFKNKTRFKVDIDIKNILITLGGSDYRNILPRLLNIFHDSQYRILVVTGTEEYKIKINSSYKSRIYSISGYLSAEEMVSKMMECDLAISGCGQTLHELSYLGIPTIGICIDKDQEPNMISYLDAGFLQKSLFWDQNNLENEVKDLIGYMDNLDMRTHISKTAKNINDGKGLERIYSLLH